jgi:hypothetical protein
MSPRLKTIVIRGSFLWMLSWVIFVTVLLAVHAQDATRNHWFLFNSWVDRALLEHRYLAMVPIVLPLSAPLFFERSFRGAAVVGGGVLLYVYLVVAANMLTD